MTTNGEADAVAAAPDLKDTGLDETTNPITERKPVQAQLLATDGRAAMRGQADWIDPSLDATCRQCRFWTRSDDKIGRTNHRYFDGYFLAPRPCALACRLNPQIRTPLEHSTPACGKFELNSDAPTVLGPRDRRH